MLDSGSHSLDCRCADTDLRSDLANAHARCKSSTDRRLDLTRNTRTAELYTLRTSPRQAGVDPLADHRPLEFAEDAEHLEQRLAGRRASVETLPVQIEVDRF